MQGVIVKIPKTIQIGGLVLEIKDRTEMCKDYEEEGTADFNHSRIILDTHSTGEKLSQQAREVTFFHELTHYVDNACNLKLSEEDVDRRAHYWYQIIKQLIGANKN